MAALFVVCASYWPRSVPPRCRITGPSPVGAGQSPSASTVRSIVVQPPSPRPSDTCDAEHRDDRVDLRERNRRGAGVASRRRGCRRRCLPGRDGDRSDETDPIEPGAVVFAARDSPEPGPSASSRAATRRPPSIGTGDRGARLRPRSRRSGVRADVGPVRAASPMASSARMPTATAARGRGSAHPVDDV